MVIGIRLFLFMARILTRCSIAPSDEFARTAKCIEGGGFRTIYRWMTPEQIVANLLSHKECEDDFNYPVKMGKITTSQE